MRFCFYTFVLASFVSVLGCSDSGSSSIIEDADQAAIDAYDAQVAENDAALGGYDGVKK